MTVTCVHVWVKPEYIQHFIEATVANQNESIKEDGNLRFDVLQSNDEPGKFLLYEAYESEEHAANHKKTDHYLKWRETVANWMLKPRQGKKHKVIALKQ